MVALLSFFGFACSSETNKEGFAGSPETAYLAGLLNVGPAARMNGVSQLMAEEEQRIIEQCMTGQGHEYVAAPATALLIGEYHSITPETAASFGFGLSTVDPNEEAEDPNPNDEIAVRLHERSPEAYDVWLVAYGACEEQARTTVDETLGISSAVATSERLWRELRADDRYQMAEQGWRECMQSRGWEAPTRDAIAKQFEQEWATLDPANLEDFHRREIAAATADAECAVELSSVQRKIAFELSPEVEQLVNQS